MYYVIKSLRMTNFLVRKGFDIQKVDDNTENSKFKVFLFKDTPELRSAMGDFTQETLR